VVRNDEQLGAHSNEPQVDDELGQWSASQEVLWPRALLEADASQPAPRPRRRLYVLEAREPHVMDGIERRHVAETPPEPRMGLPMVDMLGLLAQDEDLAHETSGSTGSRRSSMGGSPQWPWGREPNQGRWDSGRGGNAIPAIGAMAGTGASRQSRRPVAHATTAAA